MTKYLPATAWWVDGASFTARTVQELDQQPIKTGLLNSDGVPLYRVPDTVKFGFIPEVKA